MKQCPSCQTRVPLDAVICPQCKYFFEPEQPVNRTMHGLPAISIKDSLGGGPVLGQGAGRSTMFGLPAIKEPVEESSAGESEEDATRVGGTLLGVNLRVQDHGDVRSTAMGGLPTLQRDAGGRAQAPTPVVSTPKPQAAIKPAQSTLSTTMFSRPVLDPWSEDESDPEDNATMVAPSGAFADEDDPRNHSGFSRFGQRVGASVDHTSSYKPRPMNQNATLMGMSIDELAGQRSLDVRKTTFTLPNPLAVERGEQMIADNEADDLPTQNITPEDLEQAGQGRASERNGTRKRLLEKLRTTSQREATPSAQQTRNTMFGIPGVSAQLPEPAAPSASGVLRPRTSPNLEPVPPRPASGVFKAATRRSVDEDGNPLEDSGVLGRSAYIVGRGEIKKEDTGMLGRGAVDKVLNQAAESAPRPTAQTVASAAERAAPAWVDPDQSQMPGMFGNATAAISPDQISRDLMKMREEPAEAPDPSDATRVGDVDLGQFGGRPLATPKPASSLFDAATRVGGVDLLAQAQTRFPTREVMPTPGPEEPSRPLATPAQPAFPDFGGTTRPGQRVNAWREAAEEENVPEPTLNMFDQSQLQRHLSAPVIQEAAIPAAPQPQAQMPQPTHTPQPTPMSDPFSTPFHEPAAHAFGAMPQLGQELVHHQHAPAPMAHHELTGVDPAPVAPAQAGMGSSLGKVFGGLGGVCILAGVGLGATSGVAPVMLAAGGAGALLLLIGALAPLPNAARLGLCVFAALLALGVMGLILSAGALSIPALVLGVGGLFGLLAAGLSAALK